MGIEKINLAIIGGRDFSDYKKLLDVVSSIKEHVDLFISGGAIGADRLGERWADENNIPKKIFYPEWDKYGKRAGFLRNENIVDEADIIIAFWNGKSKGTKNSIDLAKKKNKKLIICSYV